MILLDSSSNLSVALESAVTTAEPQLYAAFVDVAADGSSFAPALSSGNTTSVTPKVWTASPSAGLLRQVKYLSLYNSDTVAVVAVVSVAGKVVLRVQVAAKSRIEYVDGAGFSSSTGGGGGSGDVVGPASSTADAVPLFDGTTGKLLKDGITVASIRSIPQNSKSAAYTLAIADAGGHVYHPSADTTARTFTIPSNASVPFPIGTALTFVNDTGAGIVTIAIITDTLVLAGSGTTGSRALAANGVATALKVTATRWQINGTGLT